MPKKKEAMSFEEALLRLESIVRQLESGSLSLQEAMGFFEEGVQLARICQQELNLAQQKVEKITLNANGELVIQPLLEEEV
jgi:exodeoxyribonuclease VII small subunit